MKIKKKTPKTQQKAKTHKKALKKLHLRYRFMALGGLALLAITLHRLRRPNTMLAYYLMIAVSLLLILWGTLSILIPQFIAYLKRTKYRRMINLSGYDRVDSLSPYEFEEWVAQCFRMMGYQCMVTSKSGDYGIDILIKGQNTLIAAQVKKYSGNVGVDAVQSTIAGMQYYDADQGYVITSAHNFTTPAITLAHKCGNITLLNRQDLIDLAYHAKKSS